MVVMIGVKKVLMGHELEIPEMEIHIKKEEGIGKNKQKPQYR
jgi:hypothetical protein